MMPGAGSTQAYWRLPVPEKLECRMAHPPGHRFHIRPELGVEPKCESGTPVVCEKKQ